MNKVCKVLRGMDEATSLRYYKIQKASKEASCVGMNSIPWFKWSVFPGLSGQHFLVSRNLVLILSKSSEV